MNDLISVIIPVYKVEEYLNQCIDSVLNQTYKNLEIILVDDGSPDNCGRICDEYSLTDSRIKVIHQSNKGLSEARNAGLDIAAGEWIGFVDSDDWIHSEMYELLLRQALENDLDIVCCDYIECKSRSAADSPSEDFEVRTWDGEDVLNIFAERKIFSHNVWTKLYRKHIFESNRFQPGRLYEDYEIMPKLFSKAERAGIISIPLYYYYIGSCSIMRSPFTLKKFIDITDLSVVEYYKQTRPSLVPVVYGDYIDMSLWAIRESRGADECREIRAKQISFVKHLVKTEDILLNRKQKVKLLLFFIHPSVFCRFMDAVDLIRDKSKV